MLEVKSEQSINTEVLRFDGDLTLQHSLEIKTALMNSLNNFSHVMVNVDGVRGIDTVCLQLFCSAHQTSVKMNKTLVLVGSHSDLLKKAVHYSGFARPTSCVLNPNKNCLWAVVGQS